MRVMNGDVLEMLDAGDCLSSNDLRRDRRGRAVRTWSGQREQCDLLVQVKVQQPTVHSALVRIRCGAAAAHESAQLIVVARRGAERLPLVE